MSEMGGRLSLGMLVGLLAVLVFVASACSESGTARLSSEGKDAVGESLVSAVQTQDQNGRARHPGVPDFRDWCTKKASLTEAEESLGAKVRAPADTRGRTLLGIYVGETYPDGTPVEQWDRGVILDYGDLVVTILPQPSANSASVFVQSSRDPNSEKRGLGRQANVKGRPAWVQEKGEAELAVDSSGKTLPGVRHGKSWVRWSEDSEVVTVYGDSLPAEDLVRVAESMDFD